MNLENIKSTTTWAEASGTMNNNNAKITEAIERLESAVEEGGGGGTADSVAWNKVTDKPSWITDSKPVYAKEDLSEGVQTSLDKADTALQAIPDGYATEEYTQNQVRHILNLVSSALEGKVDKVDGKQLSTEDFTTALKEKLEAISSSGGGDVDSEALKALSDRLDLIVSGGVIGVIDSFADIVAFLMGINDSVKLKDMLDTLRESILRKQNTIEDLDAIRSGASLGATAVQRGESVASATKADKIETSEWIVGSHSSAPFVIRSLTYGDNVITCNHEGKVGVGTTNLTHTLTVNGTASISGDVSISGTSTLRDVRMSDVLAIRMGVGTTISEDYALSVGGDVSVSGYVMTEGVSMYSQRSLKDVVDEDGLSLEELATIKPTRFTWKDGRDGRVHIGGIADDVQKVLPEVVRKTHEGILTIDYPVASFAVASSLVKPVTDHEERIAELERENKRLREELEMINRYIGYGNDK